MATLRNSCEGTSGATVTTSNSSGPQQFDSVTVSGAGTTQTWDNTHAHTGSTSLLLSLAAVASQDYTTWLGSITATNNGYARAYVYLTAYPTVGTRFINLYTAASAACGAVQITSTGLLKVINSAGTQVGISTAAIPLNAWARVEFEITNISGATGDMAARLYSGSNLESNTADSGGTVTLTAQAISGQVGQVRWGASATVTETSAWSAWIDDVAFSDTAALGPSVVVVPQRGARRPLLPSWQVRVRRADRVPAQVASLPAQPVRARKVPLWRRVRAASTQPGPVTVVTVAQPLPPQPARRQSMLRRPRDKARQAQPVPSAAVITAQVLPPQPRRVRLFPPRMRRANPSTTVTVTTQQPVSQPQRAKRPAPWRRRAASTQPVPAQVVVTTQSLPPQPTRRVLVPLLRRRTRITTTITVAQPLPPQPARDRLTAPRRPRQAGTQPVTAPVVVTTQALPPQPARMLRRVLPRLRRREVSTQPVPAQVVVTTQTLPPQPGRVRLVWFPRRRVPLPGPVLQVVVAPVQPARERVMPLWRRRAKTAQPVLTVVTTTQALPPQPARSRVIPQWLKRHPTTARPSAPQVVVTTQSLPPQPGRDRLMWTLRAKARQAQPVPAQVVPTTQALPPQPTPHRLAWFPRRRGRLAQAPTVTTTPLPPQPARDRLAPPMGRRTRATQTIQVVVLGLPPQPARRRRFVARPRRAVSVLPTSLQLTFAVTAGTMTSTSTPGATATAGTPGTASITVTVVTAATAQNSPSGVPTITTTPTGTATMKGA